MLDAPASEESMQHTPGGRAARMSLFDRNVVKVVRNSYDATTGVRSPGGRHGDSAA
jgi:hypothetical protein